MAESASEESAGLNAQKVAALLGSFGLGGFSQQFIDEDIDGEAIKNLTEQDITEIFPKRGQRVRFRSFIAKLCVGNAPEPVKTDRAVPDHAFNAGPDQAVYAEPDHVVYAEPDHAVNAEPDNAVYAEPDHAVYAEPDQEFYMFETPPMTQYTEEASGLSEPTCVVNSPDMIQTQYTAEKYINGQSQPTCVTNIPGSIQIGEPEHYNLNGWSQPTCVTNIPTSIQFAEPEQYNINGQSQPMCVTNIPTSIQIAEPEHSNINGQTQISSM